MAKILVLHGPNLNMLGQREPGHYGNQTLTEINDSLNTLAGSLEHAINIVQSNVEHELIDQVQNAPSESVDFIIINPAAYTHTSIALRDALLAVAIPFIEIHLSNVYAREAFRKHSYFSDIAVGVISGFGAFGYEMALKAAVNYIEMRKPS